MRRLRPFPYVFFLLSVASATSVHSQSVSLWDLNTSNMVLAVNGSSLEFRYHEPRIGMQEEGVVSGTLHFSGTVTGSSIAGTAHVFSRRCGPQPYHVTGTSSDDARVITLHGSAPSAFDAACRPVRFRDANSQKPCIHSALKMPPMQFALAAASATISSYKVGVQ